MKTMQMNNSKKVLALAAVLVMCAATLVSVAYAYNATYNDTVNEGTITPDETSKFIYVDSNANLSYGLYEDADENAKEGFKADVAVEYNTVTEYDEDAKGNIIKAFPTSYTITGLEAIDEARPVDLTGDVATIKVGTITIKDHGTNAENAYVSVADFTEKSVSPGKLNIFKNALSGDNVKFKLASDASAPYAEVFEFEDILNDSQEVTGRAVTVDVYVVGQINLIYYPIVHSYDEDGNKTDSLIDPFLPPENTLGSDGEIATGLTTNLVAPSFTISLSASSDAGVVVSDVTQLKNALAAGKDVRLVQDITADSAVLVGAGKDVSINLNGHKLTNTTSQYALGVFGGSLTLVGGEIDSKLAIAVLQGGSAVVKDTVINTTTDAIQVGSSNKDYNYTDHLTFENVTLNSADSCIIGFKNAQINIIGGEFTSASGAGFVTNGSTWVDGQVWNIEGATFYVSQSNDNDHPISVGIQCHNGNSWIIKDCTFDVTAGVAVSVRGGVTEISGCTYIYHSVDGVTSGKLQYTDVNVDLSVPHAVAVYYMADGSYGAHLGQSYVIVDGQIIAASAATAGTVNYLDFATDNVS